MVCRSHCFERGQGGASPHNSLTRLAFLVSSTTSQKGALSMGTMICGKQRVRDCSTWSAAQLRHTGRGLLDVAPGTRARKSECRQWAVFPEVAWGHKFEHWAISHAPKY